MSNFHRLTPAAAFRNYYSSSENVLDKHVGAPPTVVNVATLVVNGLYYKGRYAWVYQEKTKGRGFTFPPAPLAPKLRAGSLYGGWLFDWYYDQETFENVYHAASPSSANALSESQLKTRPFFDTGSGNSQRGIALHGPAWIEQLLMNAGNTVAADYGNRAVLLSEMFPSYSLAAGGAGGPDVTNITGKDMPTNYIVSIQGNVQWPRTINNEPQWWHNDFREAAYTYTFKLFDAIIVSGALNQ